MDKISISNMFIKIKYEKAFSYTDEEYDYVIERNSFANHFVDEIATGQDLMSTFIDRFRQKYRGLLRSKTIT